MICIIDYGVGNLFSLKSSLAHLGLEAKVSADAADIRAADRLILPGVGAFADAMAKLEARGLVPVMKEEAERKPLLGICLGMQTAVIEFARHVCGLGGANSTEFDLDTPHPVVALITQWTDKSGKVEQRNEKSDLGGTLRLGSQTVPVKAGTLAHQIYGDTVCERHRHRYEVNNAYVPQFEDNGMVISARTPTENLPEMMELPNHPFFFGVQFHPEFTSTPRDGHPLFEAFVRAAIKQHNEKSA